MNKISIQINNRLFFSLSLLAIFVASMITFADKALAQSYGSNFIYGTGTTGSYNTYNGNSGGYNGNYYQYNGGTYPNYTNYYETPVVYSNVTTSSETPTLYSTNTNTSGGTVVTSSTSSQVPKSSVAKKSTTGTQKTNAVAINSTQTTTSDNGYKNIAANAIFGESGLTPSGLVQWIIFAILLLFFVILVRSALGKDEEYHNSPLKHD